MNPNKLPHGIAEGCLVGYLNTTTHCTIDLEGYRHFYGEIMKMKFDGPIDISAERKKEMKAFWRIDQDIDFDLYHSYRESVPSLINLRILHLKQETPSIHHSYNSYELGSFSLGFPTTDAHGFHQRMKDYNVQQMAPMQVGDIVRADGKPGQYIETIYQGPDYLHCVGIERVNYLPLAPCDPVDGFGGPGYSALVVGDAEAEIRFYTEVFDHYTQLDAVWQTAEGSALGTGSGVPYRFTSFYAQSAEQNHIIMLEFQDGNAIDTGVKSRPPNQGLGMYSFYTSNLNEVVKRAEVMNIRMLSEPKYVDDEILGSGEAALFEAPSGIYIEVKQM